ncbi:MAG TPA: hypothetical protein VLM85_06455 [Polyangiaceae bacterium]|nr:hypothetical protein [Polyangiaceae bacterium]
MKRALLASWLVLAACDSGSFYAYVARIYDLQRDCLSDVQAVDIGNGPDPGLGCAPKCLVASDQDGGVVVYATTMCGPVPYGVDSTGTDPRCAKALAAVQRSDICLADGGSTDPAEAGTDAAPDVEFGDAGEGGAVDGAAE